ncbi:hypothetical protein BKA66DRAFT_113495 [Pyrenochaeta sp. MPI-SDFR-AT-0127]|nr:hypothetical protein BKA66DRAFT_113495 [Pyrenochaeta sp. MPI-SDFR-AT-0127]
MKSFAILASVAGVAVAQNLGSCAQLCVNNMANIANTQFSCAAGDVSCFCNQSNWAYGVRDCSAQACDAEQAAQAVQWAAGQCNGVAQSATGSPLAAIPILTSAVAEASGAVASGASQAASGAASGASNAAAQSTAVTTVPLVATITNSAGSVETTTTGFSTAYSALTGSLANEASGIASSLSAAASSLAGDASSAAASAA